MQVQGCRRLEGKTAVVAGASTGIGRITAMRLAAESAAVIVGAPSFEEARIRSVVAQIEDAGGRAAAHAFDAIDDASVAAFVEARGPNLEVSTFFTPTSPIFA